jgi:hypothetical protein
VYVILLRLWKLSVLIIPEITLMVGEYSLQTLSDAGNVFLDHFCC